MLKVSTVMICFMAMCPRSSGIKLKVQSAHLGLPDDHDAFRGHPALEYQHGMNTVQHLPDKMDKILRNLDSEIHRGKRGNQQFQHLIDKFVPSGSVPVDQLQVVLEESEKSVAQLSEVSQNISKVNAEGKQALFQMAESSAQNKSSSVHAQPHALEEEMSAGEDGKGDDEGVNWMDSESIEDDEVDDEGMVLGDSRPSMEMASRRDLFDKRSGEGSRTQGDCMFSAHEGGKWTRRGKKGTWTCADGEAGKWSFKFHANIKPKCPRFRDMIMLGTALDFASVQDNFDNSDCSKGPNPGLWFAQDYGKANGGLRKRGPWQARCTPDLTTCKNQWNQNWFVFSATDAGVGLGGDPHATNLDGKKFDILRVGTFPIFKLSPLIQNKTAYLALDANIHQVGSENACGPTYIQNVSLSGEWLQETIGNSDVAIRVVHWVPKAEALEVRINNTWQPVKSASKQLNIVSKVTESQVNFEVHKIQVHVSLGVNLRKVEAHKGYNFLNLNVRGLNLHDRSMSLTGLLIQDDISEVSVAPEKCRKGTQSSKNRAGFQKFDSASEFDSETTSFLSYIHLDGEDLP